jgi:SAM-dependent methyltransferase
MRRCLECLQSFDDASWRCPCCGFTPSVVNAIPRFSAPQGRDGFDPDLFDSLVELEQNSFWFRGRNRLIAWAIGRYFPTAQSLFEIGCGTGFVLEGLRRAFPRLHLVGGELHPQGLEHASRRLPQLDLLQVDARRLPFDGEFDVVGAFDVLEHIDDDRRVLEQMRAAVRPGGGILITVPQHPLLWSAMDDYSEHKRRYRHTELEAKVSAAGFSLRRVTSFVTLLLPAMAAIRMWRGLRSIPPDPIRDLATPRYVTVALEHIMNLERTLITRRTDLPFGGSLLVAADRI